MSDSFGNSVQRHETSNIVISEVLGETGVCAFAQTESEGSMGEGQDEFRIACYEGDGTVIDQISCSASWGVGGRDSSSCSTSGQAWGLPTGDGFVMTSADFDNDGNDDFIGDGQIISIVEDSRFHNSTALIPIDLNGDTYLDLIGFGASSVNTQLTTGSNSNAEIEEVSSDTGTPSCINEEVTFSITDYTDAEFNRIQLRIDCENNGSFTDWSSLSYAPSTACTYTSYGIKSVVFSIRDSAHTSEGDRINCTWNVDSGNCYSSGEGSALVCETTATGGFNDYGFNLTAWEFTDDKDGYKSTTFDWEGTGCNTWTIFRGLCPLWIGFEAFMSDLWDWVFDNFGILLLLLIMLVGGSVIWYKKETIFTRG